MSVFSDPLETPEPLSPSEYFIIDKDSCNTKPKHQGSSFSLQHLIRKCEQISKSKSASSSCSDTCLASWKCKTKRQRIYSDKNSSSTSSDEDIPILNRLKQKGRNRRRISSESDICTEQSLANPSSDKLDRAGQTAVQEMNSIVSNPDISLVSCSPGSVPDHNKNISTKSNTQASPSQKKSDESRSKFISTFRPMTPLPKTRSSSSSSSSATSKSRFASGKQKTRSSSSQVPEFRNDKSKSKSQRSRSSSYSTSRSRIHQRSRSVSRSRRYRSISLSPSRRSRWHRSRSSSSSRYFRSRSPVTRSRSTSGLRSSRYRSRSASSRGSRYKSRSDSPVKSKGYRARSVTSSSDRHRSRSESPRTSSSRLFSTGNNISRRCRSRSASSTRRRKSRSKYQSSPKRCRSQYSPWNPGRDNRSTPSSTSSSDVHRSKSLSVYHETQHHSERKNSCKFKRRRSASVSSSSTSSSDSATSSDSTSASSSTSGRRPWLKYRYKSSQDRKLSVTGRDPQERNESSKTVRDPWERNDISVTGRGPVDISTYSSAKTVLPPSTVGNVDTVTVTNAHHHSSSPHSNRPDDAQSDVPELSPFVKPEDILYFKRLLNTSEGNISEKEVQKRQFIRFLLKIKNGSQEVAKESMKAVKKMARRMDIFMLFHTLLPMCTKLSLVSETKKKLISVLDAIIFPTGRRLRPFLSSILDVIHPLLLDPQHEILAVKIITKLSKVFGQEGMLPVLRKELGSDDNLASLQSCRSLAVMTSVVGIEAVIPFISSLCTNVSAGPRKSGYELIQAVCHLMKERMQPYIGQLMDILCTGVKKKFDYTEWSGAVAGLAKISCETDIPSFSSAWDCLVYMYDTVSPHAGKLSVSVQKAVFSVLHLMSGAAKQDLQNVAESFGRMCSSSDVELRKCTVKVMHKLSQCTYIDDDLYDKMFLCPFIGQCLRSVFNDKEQEKFIQVCVRSCQKIHVGKICTYILQGLRRHETVSEVAAVVIVAVLRKNGLKDVSYSVEKEILLAFCQAVNCQISQNTVILTSFLTVIKLLGRRLYSHTQDIQQALHDRQSSPQQAKLREQIQAEINGIGSGMETSSGLVLDGCVWNSAETS